MASQRRLKEKKQLHHHPHVALPSEANPNEADSVLDAGHFGTIDPDEDQDLEVVSMSVVNDSVRLEQTGCDNVSSVIIPKKTVQLEGKCIHRCFDDI